MCESVEPDPEMTRWKPSPQETPADSTRELGHFPDVNLNYQGESCLLIRFPTEMTSEERAVLQLCRQHFQKWAQMWGSSTVTAPTKAAQLRTDLEQLHNVSKWSSLCCWFFLICLVYKLLLLLKMILIFRWGQRAWLKMPSGQYWANIILQNHAF